MNNKSKFNIIAGLAMIFLFVTSCDTEKEDVPEKGDEIQKVEIPSSDATNPIVAGQMIVIHGEEGISTFCISLKIAKYGFNLPQ